MLDIPPQPQVLELVGPDAANFAQAQFSSDVRTLHDGCWQWSAWLSPQGRVRAFFHLLRDDEPRLRLLLRGGDANDLAVALGRFVMRAKVELRPVDDSAAMATFDVEQVRRILGSVPDGQTLGYTHGRTALMLPGDPARWLILGAGSSQAAEPGAGLDRWRLADIRAGLPEIGPTLYEQLLPAWVGLNRLGAVSVSKGCYPGQEIVSRMHFRGGNTRGLYRIEITSPMPPSPGMPIRTASGRNDLAGQVVTAASVSEGCYEALASMLDALADTPLKLELPQPVPIAVRQRFD